MGALLRRPRLGQRPVGAEVLIVHQPLSVLFDFGEELLCYLAGEQLVSVLREHRVIQYRVLHARDNELAEQQVVIKLLGQPPLKAHRVKRLQQQQRPQHILRRNRGPLRGRVHLVECGTQRRRNEVCQHADPTPRMILRHALLQRHIVEYPTL